MFSSQRRLVWVACAALLVASAQCQECPPGEMFSGFTLVDASKNIVLGPLPLFAQYGPGDEADLLNTTELNIMANVCPEAPTPGSVLMELDGVQRCERKQPYTAGGDNVRGNYFSLYIPIGIPAMTHTISATPYSGIRCDGSPVGETFSQPFVLLPPVNIPSVERICLVDMGNLDAGCLQEVKGNSIIRGDRPCRATFQVFGPSSSSRVRAIRTKLTRVNPKPSRGTTSQPPKKSYIHRDWNYPFYSSNTTTLQHLSGMFEIENKVRMAGVPRFEGTSTMRMIQIEPLTRNCDQ